MPTGGQGAKGPRQARARSAPVPRNPVPDGPPTAASRPARRKITGAEAAVIAAVVGFAGAVVAALISLVGDLLPVIKQPSLLEQARAVNGRWAQLDQSCDYAASFSAGAREIRADLPPPRVASTSSPPQPPIRYRLRRLDNALIVAGVDCRREWLLFHTCAQEVTFMAGKDEMTIAYPNHVVPWRRCSSHPSS